LSRPLKIMLVAAEASGDALGAGLAGALRTRLGADVTFVGTGGPRMAEQGVESPFDIAELSVLGWVVLRRIFGKNLGEVKRWDRDINDN
jgi:lipid-A-disaccharide synthase